MSDAQCCPVCKGHGVIHRDPLPGNTVAESQDCYACNGTGVVWRPDRLVDTAVSQNFPPPIDWEFRCKESCRQHKALAERCRRAEYLVETVRYFATRCDPCISMPPDLLRAFCEHTRRFSIVGYDPDDLKPDWFVKDSKEETT